MGTLVTEPPLGTPLVRNDTLNINNKTTLGFKGKADVSITNWNNASQPSIAAGSIYEINGALYQESSTVAGTGWSASGTRYLYATVSGSSTTWSFSSTAPTWSDSLQGYYNGTSARAFYIVIDGVKYALSGQSGQHRIGYDAFFGQDVSISNNALVDGYVAWQKPRPYNSNLVYSAELASQDLVFGFISPFIPNVNDNIFLSRCLITVSGVLYYLGSVSRFSSTIARFTGLRFNGSILGNTTLDIQDGISSTVRVEIVI